MNLKIAELISPTPITTAANEQLYQARTLDPASPKHIAIMDIVENNALSHFIKAGQWLAHYLKNEQPIVIVVDGEEHNALFGLRLEENGQINDYPNLGFAAFETNWSRWDDVYKPSVISLFAHECSHVWMRWLGMEIDINGFLVSSKANKFHTSTAVTDFFMAFSEGFAEWLEVVTKDLNGYQLPDGEFWDYGFDANALISRRDQQLRYHAVKNNRFIYHTAIPYAEDFSGSYAHLHMAHITSSAFTPERLKNGSQMLSSEGAVASIFFQLYAHELFKNTYADDAFYAAFGAARPDIAPIENFLLKIFYALAKIDLTKPSLMTDFIRSYGECFPAEKPELYNTFTKATHFATVSAQARVLFGELYRVGRRGIISEAVDLIQQTRNPLVADLRQALLDGSLAPDAAVYREIWITGEEEITPTPWEPEVKVPYRFNINTATSIDFMALQGVTLAVGEKLEKIREEMQGFNSLDEFLHIKDNTIGA